MASFGTNRVDPVLADVHALVERYRDRCLWFLAADYYPRTEPEVLRTLEYIERYGDAQAFRAAGAIRQWLSRTSSDGSVIS